MQCYETILKLHYIHAVLLSVDGSIKYDPLYLHDLLDRTGVDNLSALMTMEKKRIRALAWPHARATCLKEVA